MNLKNIDKNELFTIEGGKTRYYGNGLYCNKKKCWVNWGEAWSIIFNNSAANAFTGGNAGWHSGGVL